MANSEQASQYLDSLIEGATHRVNSGEVDEETHIQAARAKAGVAVFRGAQSEDRVYADKLDKSLGFERSYGKLAHAPNCGDPDCKNDTHGKRLGRLLWTLMHDALDSGMRTSAYKTNDGRWRVDGFRCQGGSASVPAEVTKGPTAGPIR